MLKCWKREHGITSYINQDKRLIIDYVFTKSQVVERIKLRDYTTNTLSHVVSELVMRVGEWPGGALEPHRDTATYTCASEANREGPGVNSSTLFRFEGELSVY